jgi:sarcosine oxidase subunit gamma
MTPHRISPIAPLLQSLNGEWREINEMPALVALPDAMDCQTLCLADLSCLTRFGVKGAGASAWLESYSVSVPNRPNTWLPLPEGGIVARLGLTEFLIEDGLHSHIAPQLTTACQSPPEKVYPVLRQDAAIALSGAAVNELLLQTCNVNFRALSLSDRPVVLTSMVGVTVTILPGERDGLPFYRVWCDGTFGAYLWRTLMAIAQELGGSAVGIDQINLIT